MKVRVLLEEGPFDTVKQTEDFIQAEVGATNPVVVPWIDGYGIEVDHGDEMDTIEGYFMTKLARYDVYRMPAIRLPLEYVRLLPCDSECGASCINVIDKTEDLLRWMNDIGHELREAIVLAAAKQCQVFYTA